MTEADTAGSLREKIIADLELDLNNPEDRKTLEKILQATTTTIVNRPGENPVASGDLRIKDMTPKSVTKTPRRVPDY